MVVSMRFVQQWRSVGCCELWLISGFVEDPWVAVSCGYQWICLWLNERGFYEREVRIFLYYFYFMLYYFNV